MEYPTRALVFTTIEEAQARNQQEAFNRGCTGVTAYWWNMIELGGLFYLDIQSDEALEGETVVELP